MPLFWTLKLPKLVQLGLSILCKAVLVYHISHKEVFFCKKVTKVFFEVNHIDWFHTSAIKSSSFRGGGNMKPAFSPHFAECFRIFSPFSPLNRLYAFPHPVWHCNVKNPTAKLSNGYNIQPCFIWWIGAFFWDHVTYKFRNIFLPMGDISIFLCS